MILRILTAFFTVFIVAFSAIAFGLVKAESTPQKPFSIERLDWQPQGLNDVRSPCPGLDSLANHGFLPRSGKGVTIEMLEQAFKQGLNVGHDFARFAGHAGMKLSKLKSNHAFDLDDLNVHNTIEHDSSLSRKDAYFGDFHTFDEAVFNETAKFIEGKSSIDYHTMAAARCARVRDSRKRNPEFVLNKGQRVGGFTEQSLIVSVFGNPHTGVVEHPEYVTYWFRNRKLPYELGWRPRKAETNLLTLGVMIKKVNDATPEDCKGHKLGPGHEIFLH